MSVFWIDDRYQPIRVLTRSSCTQTVLVMDTVAAGQPYCVLKQMQLAHQPPANQAIARSTFAQEIKVLQTLQEDPRFPTLLNCDETAEVLTLVHSWLPGLTLQEEFSRGRLWLQEEVVEFLVQSLPVLDALHQSGFLHGDLKPAHWIRKLPDQQLSLIDFGAARSLTPSDSSEHSIHNEFSLGTLGYMAPEQAQGRPRISSDLYGLGMVALQGITGLLPAQLQQNYQGEWQWHSSSELQPALIDIVTRLVRYRWQDRYSSVSEVRADLQPLLRSARWQKMWRWVFPTALPSSAHRTRSSLPERNSVSKTTPQTVGIHGVGVIPEPLMRVLSEAIVAEGGQVLMVNPLLNTPILPQPAEASLNIVLLNRNIDAQDWLFHHLCAIQSLSCSLGFQKLIPIHYPAQNSLSEGWREALRGMRQYLWRSPEDSPTIIEVISQALRAAQVEYSVEKAA
jgi:serine/threonine protein kinase